MLRVKVKPVLLRWAVERPRVDELELAACFPHLEAWEREEHARRLGVDLP